MTSADTIAPPRRTRARVIRCRAPSPSLAPARRLALQPGPGMAAVDLEDITPEHIRGVMRLGLVSVYYARMALGLPVYEEIGGAPRAPSPLESMAARVLCVEAIHTMIADAAAAQEPIAPRGGRVSARRGRRRANGGAL